MGVNNVGCWGDRASSVLEYHHIKQKLYAHRVPLFALSILTQEAHGGLLHRVQWRSRVVWHVQQKLCQEQRRATSLAVVQYWSQIIELELLMCKFVRSLCEGDFDIYVQVLGELCPWFFALDHSNYVRWLSIHIKDLVHLHVNHGGVHEGI